MKKNSIFQRFSQKISTQPTPRSVVPKKKSKRRLPPQSRFPGRTPPTRPGNSTPRSASDGKASALPQEAKRPAVVGSQFGGLPCNHLKQPEKQLEKPETSPMGQYLPTLSSFLVGPDFLAVINKKVRKW